MDGGGALLNLIRHTQGQGERRHKGFAAGQRSNFPFFTRDRGIDHQIQTVVCSASRSVLRGHAQLKLACRHIPKARVCRAEDVLEVIALHVGFNVHAGAGHIAGEALIQALDSGKVLHNAAAVFQDGPQRVEGASVRIVQCPSAVENVKRCAKPAFSFQAPGLQRFKIRPAEPADRFPGGGLRPSGGRLLQVMGGNPFPQRIRLGLWMLIGKLGPLRF